jgi:hypothetical protein
MSDDGSDDGRLPDLDRRQLYAIAFAVLLVAAIPAAFVAAQTLTHSATDGVVYQTNSGLEVTLTDGREVAAVPFADDETFSDGNLSVASPGSASIEVGNDAYSGDTITVTGVDASSAITVTRSDLNRDFTVASGDASTMQVRDYTNINDDGEDIAYASSGGVSVTLDDLPTGVRLAAVDTSSGEPYDTASTGADGTATFDLPSGTNTIRIEGTPSDLEVRDETNPDQLIDDDNVTLRARLFSDDGTVIERQVTNGTVSLDGVPLDEELVVTVKEENANWSYRRILLESAIQDSEIYLLPADEPSAQVRFQLNDQTNRFDPQDTRLFVQKPITRNNTTEYRTISGDRFGADGEFPTQLVDNERYRLVVENDEGEQRVLGSYTVQGAEIAPLTIGEVEFTADVSEGAAMQAEIRPAPDGADHNHEVRLVYFDPEGETSEIEVSMTNSTGASIRPTTTEQLDGTQDVYAETYPLNNSFDPESDTATVEVEATYLDGTTETFTKHLGDVPDVFTDAPIDPRILELMGLVSLIALVGLLVIVSPPLAALVGAGYAGLLSLLGIVPIPMPAVVLAGLVGILATVGTNQGVIR